MSQITRRWCLLAIAGAPVGLGITAQALSVRVDGDYLCVKAPSLKFLTGKPLDRLRYGNTVPYIAQFTVSTGDPKIVRARALARFAISHDIWEDMTTGFRATLVTSDPKNRPSIKNVSPEAAQSWCLEQLKVNLNQVPGDRPIWVRLEVRSEDPLQDKGIIGEPGISLSGLIALFSRPVKDEQFHWYKEDGPFTVENLRRSRL